MEVDGTALAASLSVLVGGASGWITARASRKKIGAETESVSVSSMTRVIDNLNAEIVRLKGELEVQRSKRHDLEARVRKLERWIKSQHPDVNPKDDINGPEGTPV
jgi:uncharacterized small protein (DUF1192 family)